MSADPEMSLVEQVNLAEGKYRRYKYQLALEKAILHLEIDWSKVNESRVNQGKPKITNQEGRNAYFRTHFAKEDENLLELELSYRSLERELAKEMSL